MVQPLGYWPIFLTAVLYVLGFFQTQCGRSTSRSRLRTFKLDKSLPYLLLIRNIFNILKRNLISFIFYNGIFSHYFKADKILILTCTPLLNIYIYEDVRLACVKHLDSVHSEPSSNSTYKGWLSTFTIMFLILFFLIFYTFYI